MLREGPASIRERGLSILMVLESNFTQSGGGGAESQVRTLSLRMKRLGHRVTILTPMFPWGPQVAAELHHGLPVGRLSYPRVRKLGAAIMYLRLAAFLVNNRHRYDIWHVHIGHNMAAVACLLGPVLRKPVILKISGSWEIESGLLAPKRNPLGALMGGWLQRATAVQAISTRIARELVRCGFPADRVVVLPNAVDTSRFGKTTLTRARGEPFVVLSVGRLAEEKGLPTLLKAWAAAFRGRDDTVLRLVGKGPLEQMLRSEASQLGIDRQVQFLGSSERVETALAEAHLGVLPSRVEGLSNTLLEFMACGLPVVATAVSGSEDFIETGRNGWLVPVGDVEALASSLRQAAALEPDRLASMGEAARRDVESRASLDVVAARLLGLYRGDHPSKLGGR